MTLLHEKSIHWRIFQCVCVLTMLHVEKSFFRQVFTHGALFARFEFARNICSGSGSNRHSNCMYHSNNECVWAGMCILVSFLFSFRTVWFQWTFILVRQQCIRKLIIIGEAQYIVRARCSFYVRLFLAECDFLLGIAKFYNGVLYEMLIKIN